MIELSSWLLVPTGILIAVAYTSTGISGANFWVPVYLLWLGFDPPVAFWLALLSMLFGSSSGLFRHARQRTVDVRLAGRWLAISAPAALVGALLAPRAPTWLLAAGFGLFALTLGGLLMAGALSARTELESPGWTALGGLLTGLISVGIGAVLLPRLFRGRGLDGQARAVGTCLLVVFGTSLVATLARLRGGLLEQLRESLPEILGVMVFVAPAVIVGGQIGPRIARRLEPRAMRFYAALLLSVIGVLMLVRQAM